MRQYLLLQDCDLLLCFLKFVEYHTTLPLSLNPCLLLSCQMALSLASGCLFSCHLQLAGGCCLLLCCQLPLGLCCNIGLCCLLSCQLPFGNGPCCVLNCYLPFQVLLGLLLGGQLPCHFLLGPLLSCSLPFSLLQSQLPLLLLPFGGLLVGKQLSSASCMGSISLLLAICKLQSQQRIFSNGMAIFCLFSVQSACHSSAPTPAFAHIPKHLYTCSMTCMSQGPWPFAGHHAVQCACAAFIFKMQGVICSNGQLTCSLRAVARLKSTRAARVLKSLTRKR